MGQVTPKSISNFFNPIAIPGLSKIPVIGPIFFNHDVFVYFGYLTAILLGIYLYKTQKGLNLRAVGENPGAADAASINVTLYKYVHSYWGRSLWIGRSLFIPSVCTAYKRISQQDGVGLL